MAAKKTSKVTTKSKKTTKKPKESDGAPKLDSNVLKMSSEEARANLITIVKEKSLFDYDSVLPSGRITTHAFDMKEALFSSLGSFYASLCVLNHLKEEVEAIGGPIDSGVSLIGISHLALISGQEINTFLTRSSSNARRYGYSKWVEGPLKPGARVCIVVDQVADGSKVVETIRTLQDEADAQIIQVISILDKLDGAKLRLQDYGVDYTSIITVNDVVEESVLV